MDTDIYNHAFPCSFYISQKTKKMWLYFCDVYNSNNNIASIVEFYDGSGGMVWCL